jgi:hypothetical protein
VSSPVYFALDGQDDAPPQDGRVHLPKIIQGAPYNVILRVRDVGTSQYRDFTQYDEVRMQLTRQQGVEPFLKLNTVNGRLLAGVDRLTISLDSAATAAIQVPVQNRQAINELYFLHSITMLQAGAVIERFGHGHGLMVAAV